MATTEEQIPHSNPNSNQLPPNSHSNPNSAQTETQISKNTNETPNSNSNFENIIPKEGMIFHSEQEAYNFYNSYARKRGFSVRKGHLSRRKDGSIQNRHYVCSNEGTRQNHPTHITKKPRPLERTNCISRIEFRVSKNNIWEIKKFIDDHNHPLASPNKTFLLRSHRKKSQNPKPIFTEDDFYYGVKPNELERESDEAATATRVSSFSGNIGTNCLTGMRLRDLEKGDSQFILDFLKKKQIEEPSFFYAIQLDERERLTNCFWADSKSILDYSNFGDSICFETSYRFNRYDVPFAPFIGMNNHKQIVILGGAILLDESKESFIWLFNTFLSVMSGKEPKTIFTDFCKEICEAISATFRVASHRICTWQLINNACKYVQNNAGFKKEIENLIYGLEFENEEIFCKEWGNLMNKYPLNEISSFNDIFSIRDKWAPPYKCNSFIGTMTCKNWYESMDNLFKMHFYRKLPLNKFMAQYFKILTELRAKEFLADQETFRTKPVPLVDIPMLSEAADSYTKIMYKDFEFEYKSQLACLCETLGLNGSVFTYRVSVPRKPCTASLVQFDPNGVLISCSCKKFESMGILCMHALKVLNNNNILYLPNRYVLKRWTKFAKDERVLERENNNSNDDLYIRVWRKAVGLAVKSRFCKEALGIVENGFDRFIEQMENFAQNIPFDELNIADNLQSNPLDSGNICFEGFEFSTRE
ncbi:hypothetical protein LUZ60_011253 [Juncus effusus]|nr:hypothetical protein LUZ60_011253 [Juncus effusus]